MLLEPAKSIPVIEDADVCVLGGSCTGVFAAVRAARLGARVVIVERMNCFGGVATSGLVNVWHTIKDADFKDQIVAGLTTEVVDRLRKRDAITEHDRNVSVMFRFNSEELKLVLDELVRESKVRVYLHTTFCSPYAANGSLEAVFIENKSGRSAIRAKVFIDATGDGDVCHRMGFPVYYNPIMQPPTTCAKILGLGDLIDFDWRKAVRDHREEYGLWEDWGWSGPIPGLPNIRMCAENHIFNKNCAEAEDLTYCELEGRRYVRAIVDIIRKYGPSGNKVAIAGLASAIGIRDTRHVKCMYQLKEADVLSGCRFDDAIANGAERVDIHHSDKSGITFRYLNGVEEIIEHRTSTKTTRRWRPEQPKDPLFYQIPYRSIVPVQSGNVLIAGRMIDADVGAFGAIRQMVYMNQVGEAAGVAAHIALRSGRRVGEIDVQDLRQSLRNGGSIII